MLQLVADIFLGDFFIFLLMLAILGFITYWSVIRLREIPGYLLGWLAGFFFMILYASLAGQPQPAPETEAGTTITLNFFSVLIPAILGVPLGVGAMFLLRQHNISHIRQALEVTGVTALILIVIFFFLISWPQERRIIGIFTLAFGVGVLFTYVLYRPREYMRQGQSMPANNTGFTGQAAPPSNTDPQPTSRLNQIREDLKRREK